MDLRHLLVGRLVFPGIRCCVKPLLTEPSLYLLVPEALPQNLAGKMKYRPNLHAPQLNRQSLGLTTTVDYGRYDPSQDASTHGRKSLADLDYSPLRRITWASFFKGVLVSMGGFIFGYDTGKLSLATA